MTNNVKLEVINILNGIKDYTKCIIMYGSNSINNDKIATPKSDFDILIIFKTDTNHYNPSFKIEKELTSKNINYDYCWYIEDYFFSLLNNNIDIYLFKTIFFDGEILYSELDFIEKTRNIILNSNPSKVFKETFLHKNQKIIHDLKIYARNLSRLCFDFILTLYCRFKNIEKWSKVPSHEIIITEAKNLQLIDLKTYSMMMRLLKISKMTKEEIGNNKKDIFPELFEFNNVIDDMYKLLITR